MTPILLFDGRGLVLTRSIRRVDTNWKSHLEYYLNFTVHTTASVASVSLTQNYVHDIPNMYESRQLRRCFLF